MPYKDPEIRRQKQAEYSRASYQRTKKQRVAQARERKRQVAAQLRQYKATLGCFACSENDPDVLDFHHVIADNKASNDDSAARWATDKSWGFERILRELRATCVPLCANCHRKVHAMHRRLMRQDHEI